MQPFYLGWLRGDRYMQVSLMDQERGLMNRFPVVSGRPMRESDVYDGDVGPGNDIYSKGSLIAHSLRMLIGDEAFFRSVTRLVYGRPDPRPGNFQPRYGTTREFQAIASQESGQDLAWFFNGYLYQAALPRLVETREGDRLTLHWVTGDGAPFPMPVEVRFNGETRRIAMTGGQGSIAVPEGVHVLIDPMNKVLRQQPHIEAWRAAGSPPGY